jgi:D-alanyl-D-alanine carboxypeptidase
MLRRGPVKLWRGSSSDNGANFARRFFVIANMMRISVFLLIGAVGFAQETARMEEFLRAQSQYRGFIGSVLVAKGGKVILEKGYGMANVEWDIPNSPETKFRLGSITKQFTATSILQLQEAGKLKIEDTGCQYVENCPEAWKIITIHQLLNHTSGIHSYTDTPDFPKPKFMRVPLSPVEVLMLTRDTPLDFDPGTKWKYDNSGYIFLGAIIEKVSGEKYGEYLQKHIFGPLAMKDSGYDVTSTVLTHRASGYGTGPKGLKNSEYLDMSLPYAAGSLYSTVQDLYRWDRALYGDKVLSKASREAMVMPAAVKSDYGFGWQLDSWHKHKQVGHGGGINGFNTYFARFPDDDATVIVLSNNESGGAGAVAKAVSGILFGETVEIPVERKVISLDTKILARYVGKYQTGPMLMTITNENGHLMIEPKGQGKLELLPLSENTFFVKPVDADVAFDLTKKEMQLKQGGHTEVGKRIE